MTWVLVIAVGWLVLATLIAILIGRSVRLADAEAAAAAATLDDEPNFVVDPAAGPADSPAATAPPRSAPVSAGDDAPRPAPRPAAEPPTVPGIPVARPRASGSQSLGGQDHRIRRSGLA